MFTNSNTSINKFSHLEKIEIGYRMKLGLGYDEVAKEFGVSRSYAYDLIPYAEKFLQFSNSIDPEARYVALNESLIRRIIVSLILDCGSSEEGASRFFSEVLGIKVSVSKISMVLTEAAKKAEEFDKSISLDGIRQGANDEIFQCGIPVLTGIDAETLYIYMMEERPDRKADTWKSAMEEAKSRGLNLDATISDQGTGLIRGIPKAFPEVEVQYDVFHEMMNIGKEIRNLENRAYIRIRKDDAQPTDPPSGFSWFGWRDERRRMRMVTAEYLGHFDEMCILYDWMKEKVYVDLTSALLTTLGHIKDYRCIMEYGPRALEIEPGILTAYYWIIIAADETGNSMAREKFLQKAAEDLIDEENEKLMKLLALQNHMS